MRVYDHLQADGAGIDRAAHYARSWPSLQGVAGKKYFYELQPGIHKVLEGFESRVNDKALRDSSLRAIFSDPAYVRMACDLKPCTECRNYFASCYRRPRLAVPAGNYLRYHLG